MNMIEAKGLTKDYGSGRGIFGLDLEVDEGEMMGYVGTNGSGKNDYDTAYYGLFEADLGQR